MRPFIHEDFLLENGTAHSLYHKYAAGLPIIDYHCHLHPKEIAEDKQFRSITEVWLGGDHYKWRVMRANGVDERFITGDASDWEKFEKWAETVPYILRNPLYHWTHLELSTAFGIHDCLNPDTAKKVYERCNEKLALPEYSARNLMRHYGVEAICTTDDPIDDLQYHTAIKESGFEIKVLPTWRPDKAMNIADPYAYRDYIAKLSEVSGIEINSVETLLEALQRRHDYFAEHGCKVADHGVGQFPWTPVGMSICNSIFRKAVEGHFTTLLEQEQFQTTMLLELARMNARRGWVQQFHFGPLRNVNTRMHDKLGPDAGYDTMGDYNSARDIALFLDNLQQTGELTKTILYNINPAENEMVACMIGNFQDGSVAGKIQYGAGWWFNDHVRGILGQMNALSEQGLLSRFLGMLTDSRSFLSYSRHEYFRRILCNLLGSELERGLIPMQEVKRVEQMVQDICYYNAKNYFNF